MPNVLQIKHSAVTPTPPALEFGELAFSQASNTLFVGKADHTVVPIGGLGNFAPLASPALTGSPTTPTPVTATSNGQIASTAFVYAVVDGAAINYLTANSTIDGGTF